MTWGRTTAYAGRAAELVRRGARGAWRRRRRIAAATWRHGWRIVLCWCLALFAWMAAWGPLMPAEQDVVRPSDYWFGLDLVLGLVLTPLVALRRRYRTLVPVALSVGAVAASTLVPAAALALLAHAERRRLQETLAVAALWITGATARSWLAFQATQPYHPDLVWSVYAAWMAGVAAVLVTLLSAIGWNRGARQALLDSWRANAETARREQVARVAQARTAERARIAREMHDVLAHKISLVSLHAGVLSYQDDLTDAERKETAALVQAGAHQALEELRAVLGVLRTDDDAALTPPQASLLDLPALVAQEETAGAAVTLTVPEGFWSDAAALPGPTSRHLHRIVQECLTNARKHAPGQLVTVDITGAPGGRLALVVANRLGRSSHVPGAGVGLVGLEERAALAGGSLTAGTEGDRFVVRADLPWEEGSAT